MQKSKAAAAELHRQVKVALEDVFMISEPYSYKNKIALMPKGYYLYPSQPLEDVPRAAILIKSVITSVYLEHLSSPDCTVVLLKLDNPILLISGYMDSKLPLVQPWLTRALAYAAQNNLPVIGCFDSNAHSSLFGPFTDRRGSDLEQLLADEGLILHNDGKDPTYETLRKNKVITSMIDITVSRHIDVLNWRVNRNFNGSDHNTLLFDVLDTATEPEQFICKWHKADWPTFTKSLEDAVLYQPSILTPKKLDKMVDSLYSAIDTGLDLACPLVKAKPFKPVSHWYTKDLRLLSNQVRKQFKKAKRCKNDHESEKYRTILKDYKTKCLHARRHSWREFVSSTENIKHMSRLNKILRFESRRTVNIFDKGDGTYTNPGTDSLQFLAQTHFPQASPIDHVKYDSKSKVPMFAIEAAFSDWINPTLVQKALLGFDKKKSPGPDLLKPIVFGHFPTAIIDYLVQIYKACIYLHYTPRKWKQARVIFIPKPGKDAYNKTKSFRPISLSNYLLKTLERLVVWNMDKALSLSPIHANQFGFLSGRSTENAISNTVNFIEQALFQKEHCLGVFLDISAAFDSISIHHIKSSLLRHGGDEDMVEWYFQYLARRELHFSLHGETLHLKTGLGFPQGGVCSAKFWIIAFNPAIEIINKHGIFGNGYADDLGALCSGNRVDHLTKKMQKMLNELTTWGNTCNLTFNAQKSEAIIFTRSTRSWPHFVSLNGTRMPYTNEVRYLGVILDKRLHWKSHISTRIDKAKKLLLKLNSIAWSFWGPRPHLMRWAYTGIVRSMLSYGAFIWAHELKTTYIQNKLETLQRSALMLCAKVPASTPTSALELILGLLPLDLFLEKSAISTLYRLFPLLPLEWDGIFQVRKTYNTSHRKYWYDRIEELQLPTLGEQYDFCIAPNVSPNFSVDLTSFYSEKTPFPSQVNVFTDGSKKDDRIGAGYCIYFEGTLLSEQSFRLPDFATVFQAEVLAIREAVKFLPNLPPSAKFIKFHVDSQATLLALNNAELSSLLILQVTQMLKNLPSRLHPPTFAWTRAHVGTEGNELADSLAKEGCQSTNLIVIPQPKCALKNRLQSEFTSLWNTRWQNNKEALHTKHFYRTFDSSKVKYTIKLTRKNLALFIRIITGHNSLHSHTGKFVESIFTKCRFCAEHKESFVHFITDCPRLRTLRESYFQDSPPSATSFWSVDKVLAFARSPSILPLLRPEKLDEDDVSEDQYQTFTNDVDAAPDSPTLLRSHSLTYSSDDQHP